MAKLLDLSVYGPGHISNILQVDASVYAKAFVTDGGKDTQVVRGDGTLASISSLYVGNAATATNAPWSGITGKPTTFTPSAHTHTASDITGLPTSLKNPYKLTFGSKTYDGSAAATITASDLGALTSITKSMVEGVLTGNITSHTHSQYLTSALRPAKLFTRESMFPPGYFIITINNNNSKWILSFDVKIVVPDGSYTIRFSEDNSTKSESWYRPSASMIDGEDSVKVKFGYSRTNKWVAIVATDSYAGVSITNVANGYAPIDTYALDKLFTINFFDDWGVLEGDDSGLGYLGTVQETITIYPPSKEGHTHTFASLTSKPTTINGYGITDALTTSNYNSYVPTRTGTGASGTWGISISGNAATASSVDWSGITNKPSSFTPSSHTHTKSQITDFPTSLPANGGNADTVDGYHVSSFYQSGKGFLQGSQTYNTNWNALFQYESAGGAARSFLLNIEAHHSDTVINKTFHITTTLSGGAHIREFYSSNYGSNFKIRVGSADSYWRNTRVDIQRVNGIDGTIRFKVISLDQGTITVVNDKNVSALTYSSEYETCNIEYTTVSYSTSTGSVAWKNIIGKPSSFIPSSHTHTKSQITDFDHTHDNRYYTESEIDTILSGKSNTDHTHNYAGSSSAGGSANSAISLLYNNKFDIKYGDYVVFQQSYNISGFPHTGWFNSIKMLHNNSTGYFTEIVTSFTSEDGMWRRSLIGGGQLGWYKMLDSGNYNSYAPTLTGTGASGTWGINISGNATTATNASNANTLAGCNEASFFRFRGSLYQNHDYNANNLGIGEYVFRSSDYGNVGTGNQHINTLGENSTIQVFKNLQLSTIAWNNSVAYRVNWSGETNSSRPYGWSPWIYFLSTDNYNSYAPTLTGAGASGTWGISISGNAATASSVDWSGITNKPSSFTPSSHTHTKSQITDFPTSLPANGGNADNATNATNASNLKHNSNGAPGAISFYVTSGVSDTLVACPSYCKPAGVDYDGNTMILRMRWSSGAYGHDIYAGPNEPELWHRNTENNTEVWRKIIDSGNIGSQSVSYATSAGSATSASTSSSVTINYNNDSNSTYQMLWGSGNYVYGTAGIYCNPYTDSLYASAFYETSDERLKDFENDVNVDLNLIRSIPKMYFRWKKNPNKLQIGTSAQAVKQIYPELVSSSEDGILSVDYSKLSIVALSAIDKLHLENQDLKHEINLLKQEIEKLKGQI